MSLPTLNDVHLVNPVLTNVMVGYRNQDTRFVASRVFPSVPVEFKAGTYPVLTKKYWFADEMKSRAPGAKFARGGYGVESGTYDTLGWGLEYAVADESRAANQLPMALESIGARWLGTQSMIRKERAWASANMAASVWTTQDNNSATDWDDFEAGDPVANLRTARTAVSQLTGIYPNYLVMGELVENALINHPDILDRLKFVQAATASAVRQALAAIFEIDQVLVGAAIYNSVNEGATADYDAIIDDDALLCYVTPTPGIFEASAGYTLAWEPGGGTGQIVTYRDQSTKSDILQNSEQWVQKVVAADLGAIWLDIV